MFGACRLRLSPVKTGGSSRVAFGTFGPAKSARKQPKSGVMSSSNSIAPGRSDDPIRDPNHNSRALAVIADRNHPTAKARTSNPTPKKYNLHISCNVKPNSSGHREGITAVGAEKIDVCVAAVPRKGEANVAVARLFAQILRVPKSNVDVIRGLKSRDKVISIADLEIDTENEENFLRNIRHKLEEAVVRKT
ncbi:hypothetical protein HFD88_010323 [Aspergillus terreus]|nr:hypothetical protein HFD88_010323 [Aspergillus terreus]